LREAQCPAVKGATDFSCYGSQLYFHMSG